MSKIVGLVSIADDISVSNGSVSLATSELILPKLANDPANPVEGQLYYNTTDNFVKYYNGIDWIYSGETPLTVTKFDAFDDASTIAVYNLNSNGNDMSGTFNLEGDTSSSNFALGKFGYAWNGTGTNHLNYTSANIIPQGDYSISFWYKSSTTGQANKRLLTIKGASICSGFNNHDGRLGFYTGAGTTSSVGSSVTAVDKIDDSLINNGVWHHLAYSITAAGVYVLYLDGNQHSDPISGEGRAFNSGNYFAITSYDTGDGYNTIGMVDQVRIFNRIITSDEVSQLYNTIG